MSYKFVSRFVFACCLSTLFAGAASAQAPIDLGPKSGLGAISSSSQLDITATVQNAIQVDIDTASSGATVTGGTGSSSNGQFAVSLGTLNGLGVGGPAPGVTATPSTGGVLYSTPVRLTPRFSGLLSNAATVTVRLDAVNFTNAAGLATVREGADAANAIPVTAVPLPVTTSAQNATPFNRTVGMFIPNGSTAVVNGTIQARVVYQVLAVGL
ncbi:MAG: hypothetical protein H7Z37_07185 [Pyrinomonadaceae bacterium]|nr:hypothetical protein [Pyrinomonadaceae bacterium]